MTAGKPTRSDFRPTGTLMWKIGPMACEGWDGDRISRDQPAEKTREARRHGNGLWLGRNS